MTDAPPPPDVEDAPRGILARMSPVWLIPIVALGIALGIAWQNYAARGPLIEIAFQGASGISAGETELRYRDVAVGVVEEVGFSAELATVLVTVRLDEDIAPYVDEDAVFWIVQPEVTTRGVSGLGTVLSGVYIEGVWDEVPRGGRTRFEGQSTAPILRAGEQGIIIQLRATESVSLAEGTPVLYKGLEVGQVGRPQLSANGAATVAEAVIRAPYAGLLRSTTRFWDTSGFTFSLGAQGAELDFSSLASLISGGVAFETVASGGQSAQAGTTFALYPDEQTARASFFSEGAGPPVSLTVLFDENVAGLATGSPVSYGGVIIGEVANLSGMVDPAEFGDERVRLLATLSVRPSRLGIEGGEEEALDFLSERVAAGLRAQLQTSSILTGGLKVELLEVAGAPAATLDRSAVPFPRIPTTGSDISDVSATAQGVFERVNALPIEDLIQAGIGFLNTATALAADGDLARVPAEAAGLLADMRGIVGSDRVQALPDEVGGLIEDLRGATGDLRAVVGELRGADAAGQIVAAIAAATGAADALRAALDGAPDLITSLTQTADAARALPLAALVENLNGLALAAETVAASEDAQALPGDIRGLIAEARGTATELRAVVAALDEAQAVQRLLAAVDAAGAAATAVQDGATGLPALVEQITAVAARAEALPLDALVAEVTALARNAAALTGSEAAQAIPGELRAALADLAGVAQTGNALATQLAEGEVAARLSAALAAAAGAASSVEASTEKLPALVAELTALAAQAGALPLDALVAEVTALARNAAALTGSETLQALPEELQASLAALRGLAASSATLTQTLVEENLARRVAEALDAAALAARSVETGTVGLPDLIASLQATAARAETVPLDQLAADLSGLIASADALVAQDSTRALPAALNGALAEVEAALGELRAGGTVDNANQALAAAAAAARAIEQSAGRLPALVDRIDGLLVTANGTVAGFGSNSQFTRSAQTALREVERAAEAVQSLARALERRPNSLILGR